MLSGTVVQVQCFYIGVVKMDGAEVVTGWKQEEQLYLKNLTHCGI